MARITFPIKNKLGKFCPESPLQGTTENDNLSRLKPGVGVYIQRCGLTGTIVKKEDGTLELQMDCNGCERSK